VDNQRQDSVYSLKMKAGKRRTYFFDVRKTKGEDYYLTLTESTKKMNGEGYERHKIFLYKEDFNRFLDYFQDAVNHVKTELLPDYDFDEFNRYEEYDQGEDYNKDNPENPDSRKGNYFQSSDDTNKEDDMSW
jgi:hypothetical protein